LQKTLIIILLILSESCVTKHIISEENKNFLNPTVEEVVNKIKSRNISENGFFIEKSIVTIKIDNEEKKFVLNGKFQKPDIYLFSVRKTTGIEAARIFLTLDTLLINDRIERKLIIGKPGNLENISGISYFFIKIMFGDMIVPEKKENIRMEKIGNQYILVEELDEGVCKSFVDLKLEKIKSVELTGNNKEEIKVKYSKFGKDKYHLPALVEMNDVKQKINLIIQIKRVKIPWNENLEFIPGKGYKIEEIK
jgi:Domain of unknown function (DUF4292)